MIKQEADGTYTVSYSKRHPITRKPKTLRRKGIKTKAEAQRVYAQLIVEVNKSHEVKASARMLWKNLLPEYYQSLVDRDLQNATIQGQQTCLDAHTLPVWGNKAIGDITEDDIRNLIKVTLKEKSESHRKSMRKFINGAFTFAVSKRYLATNPVPFLQFRMGNKLKPVLKESELITLLNKAEEYNHPWKDIWTVAAYTGMRSGELYALQWKNINIEDKLIYVREAWTKEDGFEDMTKGGYDRVVEIAKPLAEYLHNLKKEEPLGPFVLPRIEAWECGRQAEVLRTFLLGINLPLVNFHALRASWATLLLSKGVEPVKVMKMGGWKDLKTLVKHYLRLSGVDIKGATAALNFSAYKK